MVLKNRKFLTSRRYKKALWDSPKDAFNKRSYPPGMHGTQGYKKLSDFGEQLKVCKQLMTHYNVGERQFMKFFANASKKRGNRGENFAGMLESRLSMIVYRAKFANTIFAAQQMVVHGHITVNGKRINRPGYIVFPDAVIKVKKRITGKQNFTLAKSQGERDVPDYIQVDEGGEQACLTRIPLIKDIPFCFTGEDFARVISRYS